MRPSERAWLTLAGGVIVYDFLAPDGETMSEGMDAWLLKRPLLTRLAVLAVTRHLLNDLNPDPIHLGYTALRKLRRRRVVVVTVES